MHDSPPVSKVYYRPIEAAIRWAGLLQYKKDILRLISSPRYLPMTLDCPGCAELRLCTERIHDAIFNGELPYGCNGITQNDKALWDSPDLTIRHLDLKRWMRDHYPDERPAFLFSRRERIAHPVITLETGQAMLVEREALKAELEHCRRQLQTLQEQHHVLSKQGEVIAVSTMPWQLRSSRLQRSSPRGSNQSVSHRPPRTSVFTTPVLFVFNPSGIRSHHAADQALATDRWQQRIHP